MCIYITDDDEQCGMSNHNGLFCHHHNESRQAKMYRMASEATDSRTDSFDGGTVVGTCNECNADVRQVTTVRTHRRFPTNIMIEETMQCECDDNNEVMYHSRGVKSREVPEKWL